MGFKNKVVTAFVLKPPVLEQAKCEAFAPERIAPPITEAKADNVEEINTTDSDVKKSEEIEHEPRRHHRRWRYRRHW